MPSTQPPILSPAIASALWARAAASEFGIAISVLKEDEKVFEVILYKHRPSETLHLRRPSAFPGEFWLTKDPVML